MCDNSLDVTTFRHIGLTDIKPAMIVLLKRFDEKHLPHSKPGIEIFEYDESVPFLESRNWMNSFT